MTNSEARKRREEPASDAPVVCIEHGAFVPCRKSGGHRYSQNPFWVKSVRDYHGSTIPGFTWEPVPREVGR